MTNSESLGTVIGIERLVIDIQFLIAALDNITGNPDDALYEILFGIRRELENNDVPKSRKF